MAILSSPTIPPATHTNSFIAGDRELIVIDPGSPYPEEIAALDRSLDARLARGHVVREIWLTHHHIDHLAGVPHLVERYGATVAAHPRTADLAAGAVRIDRTLADGELLELGSRRLRVVFTPGHTAGHHAFLEETTGLVMAGDLVAGVGTVVIDPGEGDMIEYLSSLARVKALAPRALLPAHGPILTEPAAKLDEYTRHRLWREARVLEAVVAAGSATAHELVPLAYADVPTTVHPLAERSLLAHLQKLLREGRVALEDGRYHAHGGLED
jgi:glyoxylase-like metal-dependent hydrolase (beta-lactamase superfamily II)